MSTMIEKVARAMAKQNGDDYGHLPLDKTDWTAGRGMFGGRFRELAEPMQVDYDEMARAAIEAMMEPTDSMKLDGGFKCEAIMFEDDPDGTGVIFNDMGHVYRVMIQAALKEGQ